MHLVIPQPSNLPASSSCQTSHMHHLLIRARTSVHAAAHWARLGGRSGWEVTRENGRNRGTWKQSSFSILVALRHTGTWERAGPLLAQGWIYASLQRLWKHSLRGVPERQVAARQQPLLTVRHTWHTETHFGILHRGSISSCQLQHSCGQGSTEKIRCLTVVLIFIPFFPFTNTAMSIWAALNWYTNFTITMIELCAKYMCWIRSTSTFLYTESQESQSLNKMKNHPVAPLWCQLFPSIYLSK